MIEYPLDISDKFKLTKALATIKKLPDAKPALDWLVTELDRLDRLNRVESDNTVFRQRQGVCQTLDVFLDFIEKSEDNLILIRENIQKEQHRSDAKANNINFTNGGFTR